MPLAGVVVPEAPAQLPTRSPRQSSVAAATSVPEDEGLRTMCQGRVVTGVPWGRGVSSPTETRRGVSDSKARARVPSSSAPSAHIAHTRGHSCLVKSLRVSGIWDHVFPNVLQVESRAVSWALRGGGLSVDSLSRLWAGAGGRCPSLASGPALGATSHPRLSWERGRGGFQVASCGSRPRRHSPSPPRDRARWGHRYRPSWPVPRVGP